MDETVGRFEVKHSGTRLAGVEVTCRHGHVWTEPIERYMQKACTHGYEMEQQNDGQVVKRAVQTDLSCPECGAGYSVVGTVEMVACPRCGATMVCPRCLAERIEEEPRTVRCPFCGESVVNVQAAPPVRFLGVVEKVVT